MAELEALRDDPPTEVKVVSWIVIVLSGILAVLFLGHFVGRSKDLPVDSYELVTAVIKISAAFGMLRGSALARIIFLWSYGICCLVEDAIAYSHNWQKQNLGQNASMQNRLLKTARRISSPTNDVTWNHRSLPSANLTVKPQPHDPPNSSPRTRATSL